MFADRESRTQDVLGHVRPANQQVLDGRAPLQIGAVLQAAVGVDVDAAILHHQRVTAVLGIPPAPGVDGVGHAAQALHFDVPVHIPAQVGDGGVAQVGGIDRLGQQREGVQRVVVLGIIEQPQSRLHLAAADAEPVCEPVVGIGPIHLRMPVAHPAEIAHIDLRAHAQLLG